MMRDKIEDLQAEVEAGVSELVAGEDWQRWLSVAARFPKYSFRNQLRVLAQRPDARGVGYQAWQALGHQVRRGETSISILAPCTYKAPAKNVDADLESDRPEDGRTRRVLRGFRVAPSSTSPRPKGPACNPRTAGPPRRRSARRALGRPRRPGRRRRVHPHPIRDRQRRQRRHQLRHPHRHHRRAPLTGPGLQDTTNSDTRRCTTAPNTTRAGGNEPKSKPKASPTSATRPGSHRVLQLRLRRRLERRRPRQSQRQRRTGRDHRPGILERTALLTPVPTPESQAVAA